MSRDLFLMTSNKDRQNYFLSSWQSLVLSISMFLSSPTHSYKGQLCAPIKCVAGLINTSIPQTFVNVVMWHELGEEAKGERVNLKCQLLFNYEIHVEWVKCWKCRLGYLIVLGDCKSRRSWTSLIGLAQIVGIAIWYSVIIVQKII